MTRFKENISDTNIDKQLHAIVKKEFDFISSNNPETCVVDYGSGKYGDYIYLKLKQDKSIYIDLCITQSFVDLLIGKFTIPVFEMNKVIKDNDIKWFENLINKLLTKSITEIEYNSGNIEFIDSESGETIFKSRNIFSFLWPKRVKEKWEYAPWVKQ